jgi:formylglycine-generating enzyme required for sulfatase activity
VYDTYTAAINDAQIVLDNILTPQGTVDTALTTLNSATSAFNNAKTSGANKVVPIAFTVGSLGFNMNYTPSGEFSRDGGTSNISEISTAYYIGQTEVTVALYNEVMGKYKSGTDWVTDASYAANANPDERGYNNINFYKAIAFCNKLSVRLGKTPVYTVSSVSDWGALLWSAIPTSANNNWSDASWSTSADGFRLPTEMEFVWAALGATEKKADNTTRTLTNTWAGEELGLTYLACSNSRVGTDSATSDNTLIVGSRKPNALGLYDMIGNKQELCWDLNAAWASIPAGRQVDYKGSGGTTGRTANRKIKGGSHDSSEANSKNFTWNDSYAPSGNSYGANGFRLVMKAP